jgi:hypothetical protein
MHGEKMKQKAKKFGIFLSAIIGLSVVGSVNIESGFLQGESWMSVSFQEAKADGNRRVARRTSRRTSNRN